MGAEISMKARNEDYGFLGMLGELGPRSLDEARVQQFKTYAQSLGREANIQAIGTWAAGYIGRSGHFGIVPFWSFLVILLGKFQREIPELSPMIPIIEKKMLEHLPFCDRPSIVLALLAEPENTYTWSQLIDRFQLIKPAPKPMGHWEDWAKTLPLMHRNLAVRGFVKLLACLNCETDVGRQATLKRLIRRTLRSLDLREDLPEIRAEILASFLEDFAKFEIALSPVLLDFLKRQFRRLEGSSKNWEEWLSSLAPVGLERFQTVMGNSKFSDPCFTPLKDALNTPLTLRNKTLLEDAIATLNTHYVRGKGLGNLNPIIPLFASNEAFKAEFLHQVENENLALMSQEDQRQAFLQAVKIFPVVEEKFNPEDTETAAQRIFVTHLKLIFQNHRLRDEAFNANNDRAAEAAGEGLNISTRYLFSSARSGVLETGFLRKIANWFRDRLGRILGTRPEKTLSSMHFVFREAITSMTTPPLSPTAATVA